MMNKSFFCAVLAAISLQGTTTLSITITASEFNQLYSCENPFAPTESSTIILDENITIAPTASGCEPIVAGPGFNPETDVVIFTSIDNHSVIVAEAALWTIALNITFNGTAQLQLKIGAMLALQNNPIVRMSGNSLLRPITS